MSSTLAMSWAAWVDSWLNTMLSFTGSSWRQKFLWTNLNSFNNLITRVLTWKCTRRDIDIISVNLIHCRKRLLPVAWCMVHFWDVLRTVLNFRKVVAFLPLFPKKLGTSLPEMECCCWHCQFLLNVTLRGGLGVSSRSKKFSISTTWCHTINAISRYHRTGHDCKRLRLPEFQIQGPPLLTIVPRITTFQDVIWGTVRSSWALSSSGSFPKGFVGVKKTVWRALSFSFPPGINLYSKTDWQSHERPLWYKCFFQWWEIRKYPIEFGSTAIPPECPWEAPK